MRAATDFTHDFRAVSTAACGKTGPVSQNLLSLGTVFLAWR
ncbi:hypothetical protein [Streptomyces soliscabiei]|nr:hypothetical protein [Streptomyces sp. NY05-11A]MDX2675189.1 hypothetical protein [Streptomyces sp. NY05-11A]